MKKVLAFLIGIFLLTKPALAATFPAPTGYVNDFAGVLTADQKNTLEQNLTDISNKTGDQIAVVTVKDLGGDTVENIAVKLFEQWKIGQKGKDNGVLLLIAINDRRLKIEVGYGLEPVLTDARSGDIIRNVITPKFKQGDYYGGITDGVNAIEKTITNPSENIPSEPTSVPDAAGKAWGILVGLGIFGWFFLPVLIYIAAFFGRSKRIWPGGVVGLAAGIILGIIVGSITMAVILAIAIGLIGLFLDWVLSANYERLSKLGKSTRWHQSWGGFYPGGGFSGGSGGSSGFGGFGGGSSGGGGGSGSW